MSFLTWGAIYLSYSHTGVLWFVSQVLLGFFILQWFFLLHDLGHGHFFSHPILNKIFGLYSSFFVMLPFFSWKYLHRHHHLWTGWKDKDPTMAIILPEMIPEWKKYVMNFCWKFWIPIFSLMFSLSNFWNIPKLTKLFPEKRSSFFFGIIFICSIHMTLIFFLSWEKYLHFWGLGYVIFFILSDPLLISQHAGISQYHSHGQQVTQFHMRDQDNFTRSLIFPPWVSKYILLGFNNHSLHHLYPTLPCYHLIFMKESCGKNDIHWLKWIKSAKKKSAVELLCSSELS